MKVSVIQGDCPEWFVAINKETEKTCTLMQDKANHEKFKFGMDCDDYEKSEDDSTEDSTEDSNEERFAYADWIDGALLGVKVTSEDPNKQPEYFTKRSHKKCNENW
jgi:hypothetical protein